MFTLVPNRDWKASQREMGRHVKSREISRVHGGAAASSSALNHNYSGGDHAMRDTQIGSNNKVWLQMSASKANWEPEHEK